MKTYVNWLKKEKQIITFSKEFLKYSLVVTYERWFDIEIVMNVKKQSIVL